MAMIPENPVVGGTVLRRAAIQSPNFVTGSTGWSVNQDGSAEFNNLVIRNGQIISGTALFYSGAPALGSLVASIASATGTDNKGNAYLAGVASYQSGAPFTAQSSVGGVSNFYTAPGAGGPWTQVAQIAPGSGDLVFQSNRNISIPSNPLFLAQAALGATFWQALVTGDTNARVILDSTAAGVIRYRFGPGNAVPDINIARTAAGVLQITTATGNLVSIVTSDLDIATIGRGLQVAEGANARQGLATLVGGTQTVNNTTITANTRIFLSRQNLNGTPGHLSVNRVVGTSFTINSSTNLDTSQVAWLLTEPG